jgi:hypothetical protein
MTEVQVAVTFMGFVINASQERRKEKKTNSSQLYPFCTFPISFYSLSLTPPTATPTSSSYYSLPLSLFLCTSQSFNCLLMHNCMRDQKMAIVHLIKICLQYWKGGDIQMRTCQVVVSNNIGAYERGSMS